MANAYRLLESFTKKKKACTLFTLRDREEEVCDTQAHADALCIYNLPRSGCVPATALQRY